MSTTDVVALVYSLEMRGYVVRANWTFFGGAFRWSVVASRLRAHD